MKVKKVTKVKGLVVEMLICERVNVSGCVLNLIFAKTISWKILW